MCNKKILMPLILISSILLGGCWDYRELNSLAIVAGVGLDQTAEQGQVQLTVQIVNPDAIRAGGGGRGGGGKGGGESGQRSMPVRVAASTGKTVFQAVRNLIPQSSRRLLMAHTDIIIVGETAAKQGVYPLLDFFIRDPEPRPDLSLIAGENAGELLKVEAGIEKIPAYGHKRILQAAAANGYAPEVTLQDFASRLMSQTAAPIAPWAESYKESGLDDSVDTRLRIEGTAVFKKDKLAGRLNRDETRGLLWVLGKVKTGIVAVDGPEQPAQAGLEIINADKKITAEIRDGVPTVRVEINVESNLGDQMFTDAADTPDIIASLEKLEADAVKREVVLALDRARQLNADIFDFGGIFQRRYPAEWPDLEAGWERIFPDLAVDIEVKAKIRHIGVIQKPQFRP